MREFLTHLQGVLSDEQPLRLTLSKPRDKRDNLKNVFVRPIRIKESILWQITVRTQTQDKSQNVEAKGLMDEVESYLTHTFYNADLFLSEQKISLIQSKKGRFKVLVNNEKHKVAIESHDHQKHRLIAADTPFLQDLGITSSHGKVYGHAQNKYKQINKFAELISNLLREDQSIRNIYDMGSGKGYLTFALHDMLVKKGMDVRTTGVEIRKDLVEKCSHIAKKHGLNGLSFSLGSIDEFEVEDADVVIALHACDIATDMAIAKGLNADAKYIVVAPCCHKQVRKAMSNTDTALSPLLRHGILKERQAVMITDTIRALILESRGYEVNVFEFIALEHTGKNVMITARKTGKSKPESMEKIERLKEEFGIEYHYLERLT